MRLVPRLLLCAAMTFGAALGIAVVVAVVDLYLVGHGRPSLRAPLDWPLDGVVLSVGDVLLLAGGAAVAVLAWRATAAERDPR